MSETIFTPMELTEATRMVREQATSFNDLIEIRNLSPLLKKAVEFNVDDLWDAFTTTDDIDVIFRRGDVELIRIMLEVKQWHKSNRTDEQDTPLSTYRYCPRFITNTNEEIDTIMIEHGYLNCIHSYILPTDYNGLKQHTNAFYNACETGNAKRIKRLFEEHVNTDTIAGNLETPFDKLIGYIQRYDNVPDEFIDIIDTFIDTGINTRRTLFNVRRFPSLVRYIIEKGRINIKDDKDTMGITLLERFAVKSDETKTLQILIEKGADVHYTNSSGMNALSQCFHAETIPLANVIVLLEAGSEVIQTPSFIPLLSVLSKAKLKVKVDIERLDKIITIMLGRERNVALILDNGQPSRPDDERIWRTDVSELNASRLARGGQIDIRRNYPTGDNALMFARNKSTLLILINNIKRMYPNDLLRMLNMANIRGQTPISKAYFYKSTECIQLLYNEGADLSSVFNIVKRDTLGYETIQEFVNALSK